MTVSRVISLNLCRPLDGIDSNVCDQVILIHRHDQNQLLKKGNLVELLPGSNGLVMTQKWSCNDSFFAIFSLLSC